MTFGRKKQLLGVCAAQAIPETRRNELLAELAEWVEQNSAADAIELFWILEAGSSAYMEQCLKQFQAAEGAEILRKEVA